MQKKYIYFLRLAETNKYKIGFTKNIKKRLSALRTGNPDNLRLVYCSETYNARNAEKKIHKEFIHNKIKGEWFKFEINEIEEVKFFIDCCSSEQEENYRLSNKN